MRLGVQWPSGNPVVQLHDCRRDEPLFRLRPRVNEAAGRPIRALVSPSSERLAWTSTMQEAGLRHGDVVTAIACILPKIYSTESAFAALKSDGSVTTWGDEESGGNCRNVQEELESGIEQITATGAAFAALKGDGSVTFWGYPGAGGMRATASWLAAIRPEREAVLFSLLRGGVKHIYSNQWAFAAVKDDGSVVTWGNPPRGGDSSAVREQLREGVKQIFSTSRAFAALKDDGTVVTWGMTEAGFDRADVQEELHKNASETFLQH